MGIFKSIKQHHDSYKRKMRRRKNAKKKKKLQNIDGGSYTKNIVSFILYNSVIWVYLTYILAFMDKHEIAEQLSIVIVKVIIYTVLSYLIKALVENVFKFNFLGKVPKNPYVDEEVTVSSDNSEVDVVNEPIDSDSEINDSNGAAG